MGNVNLTVYLREKGKKDIYWNSTTCIVGKRSNDMLKMSSVLLEYKIRLLLYQQMSWNYNARGDVCIYNSFVLSHTNIIAEQSVISSWRFLGGKDKSGLVSFTHPVIFSLSTAIATNILLVDEIMRAGMSSLKGWLSSKSTLLEAET